MVEIKIKFKGDDSQDAREAFADFIRDSNLISAFKQYCRDSSWDFNPPEAKFEDNIIEIEV